jgi:hypothetical protein
MKTTNNNTRSSGLPTSIPAVEPKTIIAVVLVGAMLVLWGRVLMRSKMGPASANAEVLSSQIESGQASPSVRIRAVELPIVAGRHDQIAADMFNAKQQWKDFGRDQNQNISRASVGKGHDQTKEIEQMISTLTKAVVLDAIVQNIQGRPDKASINGTLVSAGSAIEISVGKDKYTLEVNAIKSKQVELTWQGHMIISQMPDYNSGQ